MITILDQQADRFFDRCLAVHKAMTQGVAQVSYSGSAGNISYTVDWSRPDRVLLKVSQPARAGMAPSSRSFSVSCGKFYAYEAVSNRYISRQAPGADLEAKLRGPMGGLDEVVSFLINPKNAYLERFRLATPWTTKGSRLSFKSKERKSSLSMNFDSAGRLALVVAQLGGAKESWRIAYPSRAPTPALAVPRGALKVDSFRDQKAFPKFDTALAKAVLIASAAAYDRLRPVSYTVEDFKVTTGSGRFRQDRSGFQWEYFGERLIILDSAQSTAYVGPCKLSSVPMVLNRLSIEMEPLLKNIVQGANPVRHMLGAEYRAHSVGSMVLEGAACDLVEANAKGVRVNLVVRKQDRFLRSVSIHNLDPKGRIVYQNERIFRYGPPLARLAIPAGFQTVALPAKGRG